MSLREKMNIVKNVIFNALPETLKPKEFTFRDKISKSNYIELKNGNKLYSGSAKAIRESAIRNKGVVRGHLRFLKNTEGQHARLYHVGLCFLRGKKYSEVEPNVEDKHRIKLHELQACIMYYVNRDYAKILVDELDKFLES